MTDLIQLSTTSSPGSTKRPERRPSWLRIKLATPQQYRDVKQLVDRLDLNTVCQEARCPNIYECWGEHGTATLMILGDTCTRRCGFCSVKTGKPPAPPDPNEPGNVAEAVEVMGLKHAVITSVDRDDLADGGAQHFADVINAIHERTPACAVEVLTPDFRGVENALDTVLGAKPAVFSSQHGNRAADVPCGTAGFELQAQPRPSARRGGPLGTGRVPRPGQDRDHARSW